MQTAIVTLIIGILIGGALGFVYGRSRKPEPSSTAETASLAITPDPGGQNTFVTFVNKRITHALANQMIANSEGF